MAGFGPSRKLSDKSDRNTRTDQTNVYSMNEIWGRVENIIEWRLRASYQKSINNHIKNHFG